ncbi:DUF4440 domain-containing protein [Candidatus Phyllobacterium onerii]|uniref:DUF4440 domain-containing protein n=1 Tax=Candidatus Phyllobacterium onerii TaxID=3020828 RepID=UPI003A876839
MSDNQEWDISKFRALEEQLLDSSVRRSVKTVASLLADEFIEFGSSGAVYNKHTVIDAPRKSTWTRTSLYAGPMTFGHKSCLTVSCTSPIVAR